jgi:hypothetical protein
MVSYMTSTISFSHSTPFCRRRLRFQDNGSLNVKDVGLAMLVPLLVLNI